MDSIRNDNYCLQKREPWEGTGAEELRLRNEYRIVYSNRSKIMKDFPRHPGLITGIYSAAFRR